VGCGDAQYHRPVQSFICWYVQLRAPAAQGHYLVCSPSVCVFGCPSSRSPLTTLGVLCTVCIIAELCGTLF